MTELRQVDVRGLTLTIGTLDVAVDVLEDVLKRSDKRTAVFANVHVVETARRDPQLSRAVTDASFVFPDGAPVAWAARILSGSPAERICGSDIFDQLCRRSERTPYRHFFFGSTRDVLDGLVERVSGEYPGLRICGTFSPPFGDDWLMSDESVDRINAAAPDVVWVGLGAPKQEIWMASARDAVDAPLLLGVGAVFDFVSGYKRRAPEWMQRTGLEWLFRLAQEPRRLVRRYALTNTAFLLGVAREAAVSSWRRRERL